MKIIIFLEGTTIMHRSGVGHTPTEIVRQVQHEEPDRNDYVPIANAVNKLTSWKNQGAELYYLTSRKDAKEIDAVRSVLKRFYFPNGQLLFRQKNEGYKNIVERVMQDVLIEDDCKSIGAEHIAISQLRSEKKDHIVSIIVPEFEGIDHLDENLSKLFINTSIVMDQTIIQKIFEAHDLGSVKSVQKIEIGFTNAVYTVNNEYILKVCEDVSNEERFEREVFLYHFFTRKIPVPQITVFDRSKSIYEKLYMIYPKIKGDTLYSQWHTLSDPERKEIIKQLCTILRTINASASSEFAKKFNLPVTERWHDTMLNKISDSLEKITQKKLLSSDCIQAVNRFVSEHHRVLNEQDMALVYWDAHFDNILVRGTTIVGILDFERTEIASIDFVLDIVKRMMEYPKKYMSKEFEKFAIKKDYVQLLGWFKEFSPELFEFEQLDTRLKLYALEHDLKTLTWYTDAQEVKEMIAKTIDYSSNNY